jgi:NADH dehydrogenase
MIGDGETRPTPPRRVVILGGGFAGFHAARRLQRAFAHRPDLEVVLISRENFVLFTPMLHEVAAGDLDPADIVVPLRTTLRRVRLIQAEIADVDVQARVVRYAVGTLRRLCALTYDYLVLALGSDTNFFGTKGIEAAAATMKTLGDAALMRNRMVALLEDAAQETDERRRRRLMTFVVAGAGFAGVETVGAINDFLREALRYYPELNESMLRVVLVGSGKVVLPELGERLGRYAQRKLQQRGVELRLETHVTGYEDEAVCVAPGDPIGTMSLIWTAGVIPAAALGPLPVDRVRGRVRVNEFLEVAGHEGVVWAVGDCAAVPDERGGVHPSTAQHGMRQAIAAAKNIAAAVRGEPQKPFRFSTIGQLASIGHRTGVAQILGMRFSGFVAWWLWRGVYLSKLPTISKKVRVAIKWSLDLLFPREIGQLVTLRDVERVERLAETLREKREATEPVGGASRPAERARTGQLAGRRPTERLREEPPGVGTC